MEQKRTKENEDLMDKEPESKKINLNASVDMNSSFEPICVESNPFLAPPVLRLLLKKVDLASELKELRKVCAIWDQICVLELKDRAFQGSIKPIKLSWQGEENKDAELLSNPKPMPISEVEVKLVEFLEDTQRNPRIFRGFQLNYPQIIEVIKLDKFRNFFSDYSPYFLTIYLDSPEERIDVNKIKGLNAFLDKMAFNLRRLEILESSETSRLLEKYQNIEIPGQGRFPKLQNLILKGEKTVELFKMILGNIRTDQELFAPNLKHFELNGDLDNLFRGNLTELPSFWTKLTHLDIGDTKIPSMLRYSSGILSLSRAGMTLKSFSMYFCCSFNDDMDGENWDMDEEYEGRFADLPENLLQICENMTAFFRIQANSIQDLSIKLQLTAHRNSITEIDEDSFKIELPEFTSLRRLEIKNFCEVHMNGKEIIFLLSFHSYSLNFPLLEDLTIIGEYEDINNWELEEDDRPLTLKRLKVTDGRSENMDSKTIEDDMAHLMSYVRSVETLEVGYSGYSNDFFMRGGEELPWIESLKVLHVYKIDKPLKLGHLKNLKTIVIEHDDFELVDMGFNLPNPNHFDPDYKRYLNKFIHIAKLDLDLIKFRGFKMSQKIRTEFVKFFPYRVEFVEKPIGWRIEWNVD